MENFQLIHHTKVLSFHLFAKQAVEIISANDKNRIKGIDNLSVNTSCTIFA